MCLCRVVPPQAAAKAAAAAETEKRTSDLKGKRWTVDADGNIIVIKETPIPAKASLGLSTYHSAKVRSCNCRVTVM